MNAQSILGEWRCDRCDAEWITGDTAPPPGWTAAADRDLCARCQALEACTGAGDCPAALHVHGCYADHDGTSCEDQADHAFLVEQRQDPEVREAYIRAMT